MICAQQQNLDTGKWEPAVPLGPQGWVAKLEHWLYGQGAWRLAGILGRIDERGL